MPRWAFDDLDTAETAAQTTNVSGVHAASTRPAPHLEDAEREQRLLGSIPIDQLAADFQPIVNLNSGETYAYEVLPRCLVEGLTDPEDLFARATFEKTTGELGRAIRAIAVRECVGCAIYLPVHPGELKDRYLVRPDDPICGHDAQVFLQLSQPTMSSMALQMVRELGTRGGVGIVIDDLGAGPSTLKQLVDLAPAAVKLDRELLAGLDQSMRKQIVVRSIVGMCDQLGARVIAKGLDSEAELAAAIACGVMHGQGNLLGEPAPLPAISMWPPAK
jgi:EAL domain-containing protein (putative c-di-GMP-specific phosphodiesterase class I)